MREQYQSYLKIAIKNKEAEKANTHIPGTSSTSILAQIQAQIQQQTAPKILKEIVTEIIGDIMDNIRKQILQKMKSLDVIVKEPLHRSASFDDYNMCFENFRKRFSLFQVADGHQDQAIFYSGSQ
jgi:hypothetical protein